MTRFLSLALAATASIAALTSVASAGDYNRYQPSRTVYEFRADRCPDLIEDRRDRRESRRDERYDYSRRDVREDYRDRRESRRDERVIVCPSSSWVKVNDYRGKGRDGRSYNRYDDRYVVVTRPTRVRIVYDNGNYFRLASNNTRVLVRF